jgi:type VI secretion system protein ImpA
MSSGRVVDLDALLAPLSNDAPSGINLRDDASSQSIYYRLKDLRSTARATERRGDAGEESDGAQAEWRQLFELTQAALGKQSKDLEVACWLVEALVRRNGFAGLRDGFMLLQGLFGAFPENLHSLQDEEGLETFLAPLTGLNGFDGEGTLIQPIRKVPVTTGGDQPFAFFHYTQAEDLERLTDAAAKERRSAAGVPTIQKFDEVLRASPKDFLRALLADLRDSIAALDQLANLLSDKYGNDASPTSRIKETLEAIQDLVRSRTKDLLPPEPSTEVGANGIDTSGEPAAQGSNGAASRVPGAITNREEALRTLGKISEFFKATEPQSTIAFTLDDVIRRARMSLPELLAELLPDEAARRMFLLSAGIKPPDG